MNNSNLFYNIKVYQAYRDTTVLSSFITTSVYSLLVVGKCEDLNISLCQGLHYNKTQFPNDLNHVTQDEARLEVNQFFPLVAVNCSPELALFLCSLYAPRCNGPPLPCQELCNRVQNGCIGVMKQFGFSWPNQMTCDRFPSSGNGTDCVDTSQFVGSTTAVPSTTNGRR